jgi:aspartate kinase
VIVMKFGGTSVADADRILAAAEIVRQRLPRRPVVVVSALAGVTDLLVKAVACAREGDREAQEPILADLVRRHRWAAGGAVKTSRRRHDLDLAIDAHVEELRQVLRSVRVLGEGTPRAADAILAAGEVLSSKIVATALVDSGLPARWVDAREVVATDAAFGAAVPQLAPTADRVRAALGPHLDDGAVPILGGFIGRSPDGHTTTLGRGGSDLSAAILGAVLSAEEIEIWTDVDGILSADPRRVPDARTRERVSFSEAAELAFYGAKVLHPAAIAPAVERGIPVRVLNAFHPEAPGTVVLADAGHGAGPLASIASRGGVTTLRVVSRTMRVDPEFLGRVLAVVGGAGVPADLVVSSEVGVCAAVAPGPALDRAVTALEEVGVVETSPARGIVCVVGSGLATDGPTRGRVLRALARHDPELIALGGSRTSVAAIVTEAALDACVRDLHREFFEGAAA